MVEYRADINWDFVVEEVNRRWNPFKARKKKNLQSVFPSIIVTVHTEFARTRLGRILGDVQKFFDMMKDIDYNQFSLSQGHFLSRSSQTHTHTPSRKRRKNHGVSRLSSESSRSLGEPDVPARPVVRIYSTSPDIVNEDYTETRFDTGPPSPDPFHDPGMTPAMPGLMNRTQSTPRRPNTGDYNQRPSMDNAQKQTWNRPKHLGQKQRPDSHRVPHTMLADPCPKHSQRRSKPVHMRHPNTPHPQRRRPPQPKISASLSSHRAQERNDHSPTRSPTFIVSDSDNPDVDAETDDDGGGQDIIRYSNKYIKISPYLFQCAEFMHYIEEIQSSVSCTIKLDITGNPVSRHFKDKNCRIGGFDPGELEETVNRIDRAVDKALENIREQCIFNS